MKLPRRTLLQFVGAAVAAPSLSRIAMAQTCSSRRALTLASVFLAGSLNCFFGFSAIAQDAPSEGLKLADDIHETVDKVPVTVTLLSGKTYTGQMIVTHYRPEGPGPFPIVIFNHGRSAAKEKRAMPPRERYTSVARYWIRRGFAVFVPTRLGYGDSGTDPDPEYSGRNCDNRNFGVPLAAMLKAIGATAELAKTLPWADTKRLIIMGQSYGGFGSIGASAENRAGLIAAINFAGGGGGNPDRHPMQPCSPAQIASLYNNIGKHATVPTLWLYAENDQYWGPEWPRKWHAAYVKDGGRAELATFPAVGADGHALIRGGFRLWRPVVDRFIGKLGFPPPKAKNAPPPAAFAALDDANKLPYVTNVVKSDGYQKFLDADLPRAFAISRTGAWAWRTGENAVKEALDRCEQNGKRPCALYAVDDAVVWKP
jgi:dienelactone hydrolase